MESRVQPHSQTYGRDEKSLVRPEAITPYVWLCALVLAGILPFLGRAINLDEPQYLHVARSAIEHDWLFPQDKLDCD